MRSKCEVVEDRNNNVLKKHGIMGSKRDREGWRLLRVEEPNEFCQLDIKGHQTLIGQRYWFVACTDDTITVDTPSTSSNWVMNPR